MTEVKTPKTVVVEINTNRGAMKLELNAEKAPKTVANFIEYVKSGFFEKTIFHRVIPGFMIQGGGFTEEMEQKRNNKTIENEADNGLKNTLGSIAMARTSDPHSATSQFFINLAENGFLDYKSKTMQGWGYTVFGNLIEGKDVLQAIGQVPTGNRSGHQDVPRENVVIESVKIIEDKK